MIWIEPRAFQSILKELLHYLQTWSLLIFCSPFMGSSSDCFLTPNSGKHESISDFLANSNAWKNYAAAIEKFPQHLELADCVGTKVVNEMRPKLFMGKAGTTSTTTIFPKQCLSEESRRQKPTEVSISTRSLLCL